MIPFNALTVLVRQQEGYLQIKIQIQNDLLEMQQVCIQSDMKIHLWNSSVIGDPTLVYAEYTFTHSWVEIFFLNSTPTVLSPSGTRPDTRWLWKSVLVKQ